MTNTANYTGTWELISELSIYQSGEPPASGSYTIRRSGSDVHFLIKWQDSVGQQHELHFGGPLDGKKHPASAPGVSDVLYRHVDSRTLESIAYQGEQTLMVARRVADESGELLVVSQTLFDSESKSTNFQVYRRSGN